MLRPLAFLVALSLATLSSVHAQNVSEMAKTAEYVASLQNPDGGFASTPGGKSTSGGTVSAVRVLKYTGGSVKDLPKALEFLLSCYDENTGAFSQTPGGKPDVRTTAIGMGGLYELKLVTPERVKKTVEYISKNAKEFEEIRLAVSGLEVFKTTSPEVPRWTKDILDTRNPDGSFGQGASQPRETGSKVAALLRMGHPLDKKEGALAAIRSGQRPDGGWSRDGGTSDLETSYRIMRALFMLKEKPDTDRLRAYVATHKNADGSYATKPGAKDGGGTYYCTVMNYWARQLDGEPALVETAGFVPLFNGSDLQGWEGNTSLWAAKDGKIVGTSPGLKHNEFLATTGTYSDFYLKLSFRMRGDASSNSGVQFRSVRVPGTEMSGYQADIGQGYWGCLYDESRRNKVLVPASKAAAAAIHPGEWNHYVIRAMGNQIVLTLNGVTSVTYREEDPTIARAGKIALQIHAGGPMTVEFKDLFIQPLPQPVADSASTPGFHLRTIKTPGGERKYSLYLPKSYDGTKPLPVVLFLHGSGERGEDGIISAQVGLGAAIARRPDDFPAIAIFPQARKTWSADSDDARDALLALDDVMAHFKGDPARVVLTGLSMGGAGAWGLAAKFPDRFSAVIPICGRGRTETASTIKTLPTWVLVGDEDGDATVQNSRAMVKELTRVGGAPGYTEYRGVGHNSWDRAYNDGVLIEWMLSQARR